MGLTVHFKLIAPPDAGAERASEIVRTLRRRAQGFRQRGRVDNVLPIGDDAESLRWAVQYKSIPHPTKAGFLTGVEIPAEQGFLFPVAVGEDCEPLWLGLCRYPKTVILAGRRYRTDLPGWIFHGFTKTQYASLHGWEYFRRCHTAVVDLLGGMHRAGLQVEINDEGEYWPGQDLSALRRNLDESNGMVAAMAGALKDGDGETKTAAQVESPIFRHKHFERLEARGEAKLGARIRQACGAVSDSLV